MSITFIQDLPRRSSDTIPEISSSDEMLMARHHAFSTCHKCGKEAANQVILFRHNKQEISDHQCIGVDTELRFYDEFREKIRLVPALDCGDHTDYVGEWKNMMIRIDVTTNLKYKKVSEYAEDENHLIVLWNIQEQFGESFHVKEEEYRPHPLLRKVSSNGTKSTE